MKDTNLATITHVPTNHHPMRSGEASLLAMRYRWGRAEGTALDQRDRAMQDSLARLGCLTPVIVAAEEDGYEVLDGERRCRAALRLGWLSIPAQIYCHLQAGHRAVIRLALAQNLGGHPLAEMVLLGRKLARDRYGRPTRLEGLTAIPSAVWTMLDLIADHAPDLLERVEAEELSLVAAAQIAECQRVAADEAHRGRIASRRCQQPDEIWDGSDDNDEPTTHKPAQSDPTDEPTQPAYPADPNEPNPRTHPPTEPDPEAKGLKAAGPSPDKSGVRPTGQARKRRAVSPS